MKQRLLALGLACALLLGGCASQNKSHGLDPKQPVTITIWHYYNGAQKKAFDRLVEQFNDTVGLDEGIIVEAHNQGDVTQLEESVMASVNKEVGSKPLPNIFASYADTAFSAEQLGLLANLDQYLTDQEKDQYVSSYLEEGRIGGKGELRIFPTAKSTEVFLLNQTDWEKFSQATGASLDQLKTKEGVVEVAEAYYNWTDSLTPDVPDDGKAFYGRDAVANLFIVGSKQLGCELFEVKDQKVTLHLDEEVMRRIWDVYYIPRIKGYFGAYGRFRADDAKVGKLISLVGSTSSASYFPTEVTDDNGVYPIDLLVLPTPVFEGGQPVAVQQGAGMVVTKGAEQQEYASVVFLKWFTEDERSLMFSASSGYLPVKKSANDYELMIKAADSSEDPVSDQIKEVLRVAFDTVQTSELYTSKTFDKGSTARKILEYDLADKAVADLEQIEQDMAGGMSRAEAIATYVTEENFQQWYQGFCEKMEQAVQS